MFWDSFGFGEYRELIEHEFMSAKERSKISDYVHL